jgi:hypothetical protein
MYLALQTLSVEQGGHLRVLWPHGAEGGFDPYQGATGLNEDNYFQYIHGEIPEPGEKGDWVRPCAGGGGGGWDARCGVLRAECCRLGVAWWVLFVCCMREPACCGLELACCRLRVDPVVRVSRATREQPPQTGAGLPGQSVGFSAHPFGVDLLELVSTSPPLVPLACSFTPFSTRLSVSRKRRGVGR